MFWLVLRFYGTKKRKQNSHKILGQCIEQKTWPLFKTLLWFLFGAFGFFLCKSLVTFILLEARFSVYLGWFEWFVCLCRERFQWCVYIFLQGFEQTRFCICYNNLLFHFGKITLRGGGWGVGSRGIQYSYKSLQVALKISPDISPIWTFRFEFAFRARYLY